MSKPTTVYPDHEKIIAMLPWYVNKTLDTHQLDAVEDHIADCSECRQEVTFLQSIKHSVTTHAQENHASHANAQRDFASVMDRINSDERAQETTTQRAITPPATATRRWFDPVLDYLADLTIPQWSATALAGFLVVFLGFNFVNRPPADDYSVLSSSQVISETIRIAIELDQSADPEKARSSIQRQLNGITNRPVIEAVSLRELIITLPDPVKIADLSELITELETLESVSRAEIAP